jgi:hypothetical protein
MYHHGHHEFSQHRGASFLSIMRRNNVADRSSTAARSGIQLEA